MENWTESSIPDQTGRVALVTGANSGIGLHTARALAEKGARVVLGCRTRSKAEAARTEILRSAPNGDVSILDLDVSSLGSVEAASSAFTSQFDRLDLLINNAGVMATPKGKTVDGYETQFATNHLGHAALTAHLLPLILANGTSRVVSISSIAHRNGKIAFDDLQSEKKYRAWQAYGQSKLANLLFIYELQRRLSVVGASAIAVAAHPGLSHTNLADSSGGVAGRLMALGKPVTRLYTQSAQMGALPTLRAATDPDVRGGEYYGPGGPLETRGHPTKAKASRAATDAAAAARLWKVTVELTGVPFVGLGS